MRDPNPFRSFIHPPRDTDVGASLVAALVQPNPKLPRDPDDAVAIAEAAMDQLEDRRALRSRQH